MLKIFNSTILITSILFSSQIFANDVNRIWVKEKSGIVFTEQAQNTDFFQNEMNRIFIKNEYANVIPFEYKEELYKKCDNNTCFNFKLTQKNVEETIESYISKNPQLTIAEVIRNIKPLFTPEIADLYINDIYNQMTIKGINNPDLQVQRFYKKLPIILTIEQSIR